MATDTAAARYRELLDWPSLVENARLTLHWIAPHLAWTFIEQHGQRSCYLIDAASNEKQLLFDEEALLDSLSATRGQRVDIHSVDPSARVLRFGLQHRAYDLDLRTMRTVELDSQVLLAQRRAEPKLVRSLFPQTIPDQHEARSPSGRWLVTIIDGAVGVRASSEEQVVLLTPTAERHCEWQIGQTRWSKDETWFAVQLIDFGGVQRLPLLHIGDDERSVGDFPYAAAGSALPRTELILINRISRSNVKVALPSGFQYQHVQQFGAHSDDAKLRLWVFGLDRLCQVASLFEADAFGNGRIVFTEATSTFFQWPFDFIHSAPALFLNPDSFLWLSERSGFRQLYLIERSHTGAFDELRALTHDPYPVEAISAFDAKLGIVFYTARSNLHRPFDVHLHRCDLNGVNERQLTQGPGVHEIHFSDDHAYFFDSWSNPAKPPQHEMRSADGHLTQVVARAGIDALTATSWIAPREFSVLASDGITVLHGVIFDPPDRKDGIRYPIVEYIYGGPFVSIVPRTFVPTVLADHLIFSQALAQLGFAVVVLDARGTPGRDKAFQDIAFRSWGTYEINDHATAIRQLAEQNPWLDLARVGIFGNSYGGYFATRALLTAPDLYKVGVAGAPAQDLRTINAASIELYLGHPNDNPAGYERASNLGFAKALQGKLLLIHPLLDVNAPLSQTLHFSRALIDTDRPFDMLLMPGLNHQYTSSGSSLRHPYFKQTVARYFVEHLTPQSA